MYICIKSIIFQSYNNCALDIDYSEEITRP